MPRGSHITIIDRLRSCTALVSAAALFVSQSTAYALPQGGQVNGGQASIASSGNQLTVTQSSQRAIIDWNSFNIGAGEGVRFNQPSSSSIALNRIHDANPSQIYGSLTANGNVWLINPNGILFGNGAQVNLGGLLATASDIDNDRFMKGDYTFNHPGNPNATISNSGNITIADGGLAALVGPNVNNSGLIEAKLGKVQLGSGDTFTLDLYGDGLINLQASPAITQQLVDNSGAISADGGSVLLTAAAAENVINSLINMDGYIQANSVGDKQGSITLYAEGSNAVAGNVAANKGQKQGSSTVLVSGTLDASGYGSSQIGGNISVLGDNVGIMSGAFLDASGDAGGGTIKIGGDFHGAGTTPTALNTYVDPNSLILANAITQGNGGNVTVWSDGNTYFYGNILAEGGVQSGNGGFVETSGHGYLEEQGYVNLTAPNGNKGTWLLDPTDITIEGETASVFNSPNLVDYYALNDGSGTTATDSSGNGNNGTLNGGVTWSSNVAPAPQGNAYSAIFNGTTGYISAGAAGVNPSTSDLTVSAWVNLATFAAGAGEVNQRIVFTNIDGNNTFQLAASDGTGTANTFTFAVNQGGTQYSQSLSATNYSTNTWYNIVGTFNKTTDAIAIYVNGAVAASVADPGFSLGTADNKLYLGARNDGFGYTNGKLDDVSIYNAALSANNIAELAGTLFTVDGIEKMSQTADVSIQASHNITMDFQGDTLAMTSGRNLTLTAGNDILTASNGTIQTSGTGSIAFVASRDINLSNALNLNAAGSGSVTLQADRDIITNGTITTHGGNVLLNSDHDADSAGAIDIAAAITSNGGNITSGGGSGAISAGTGYAVGDAGNVQGIAVTSVTVDAGGGNVIMNGQGYGSSTNDDLTSPFGIFLNGGTVQTNGTGTVTLNGIAGGTGAGGLDIGVLLRNTSTVSTANGAIIVNGTGGGGSSGTNSGVHLSSTGTNSIAATGTGNVTVTGTGNGSGGNQGVDINAGDTVSSAGGNVNITGFGSTTDTIGTDYGIWNLGTISTTGIGTITIAGTGGGTGASSDNYGVKIDGGAISSTNGALSLTGTGGGGSGGDNFGVYVYNTATVSTVSGTLSVTGTGGNTGGAYNAGVVLSSAGTNVIHATGTGDVTITGTGRGTGGIDNGVWLNNSADAISSAGGNVSITGTGSTTDTSGSDYGIYTLGTISTSGTGTITLVGTGGGTGGAANGYGDFIIGNITSTGSGLITITSTGGNGATDFLNDGTPATIGGAAATGNITLNQDTATWGSFAVNTGGIVTFAPRSAGTTIGVANSSYGLNITSTLLGNINSRVSEIDIGSTANTGGLTASAFTWGNSAKFITGSGVITISGAQAMGSNNVTLETNATPTFNSTVTTTGGATLEPASVGTGIGVAGGAGALNLGTGILGDITAGSLTVGNSSDTGAMTLVLCHA